jgi:branched-chain amino acid aminotransferase
MRSHLFRLATAPRGVSAFASGARFARFMSVHAEAASSAKPAELDVSKLVVEKTSTPKTLQDPSKLIFGHNFTGTLCRQIFYRPSLTNA